MTFAKLPRAVGFVSSLLLAACAAPSAEPGGDGAGAEALGHGALPAKLADTHGVRKPLRLSETHVYFVDEGRAGSRVARVAKTGGPTEDVLTLPGPIDDVLVDDTWVWAVVDERVGLQGRSFGEVFRAPLAGGPPESRLGGELAGGVLAGDATHLYVAAGGRISRFPKDGSAATAEVLAENLTNTAGLAVDDANVYWGDMGPGNPAIGCNVGDGKVMAMPKAGGTPRVVADREDCPVSLEANAGAIWFRSFFGPLRKIATGGGAVTQVAANAISNPAFDGAQAFFGIATPTETDLESVADGSLVPTVFATTGALVPQQITAVAVDATHAYYALADLSTNAVEIRSIAK